MNNTPGHNTIRLTGFVRSWEVSAITATANSSAGALLPDEGERVGTVAKFFRALGDANRLRLLEFLVDGEHSVGDCVANVGLAQSRVSTHLACLADCGYITARRAGRWCYYRVTDPRVADLVLLARSLAADNCAALTACDRIDSRPASTSP